MKIDKVKNLLKDVPLLSDHSKVFKLNKGWSKDEKYYIESFTKAIERQYACRASKRTRIFAPLNTYCSASSSLC